MTARPRTFLGFDFGLKRIGVAVGQTRTSSASPLRIVAVRSNRPDWSAIADLVGTWSPDALVVGLPLNMDGSEQDMTHSARRFARQLEGRFGLPVHLVDERLSTREARTRLHRQGVSEPQADPVAAQVILEDWLSSEAAGGRG